MRESTYFTTDQLVQGGLTAELLYALKARLNGVMRQILEMRQLSARQDRVLHMLAEEVVPDIDASIQDDMPARQAALEDLQRLIRLADCQSASIDSLAKLAELISERLHAPLRLLRLDAADMAGTAPAAAMPPRQSGSVIFFDAGRIQVAAARQATAAIGEAFEMLSIVESQATALSNAQGLAMEALHGRLVSLATMH
jgi:hypothetical protein